MSTTYIITFYTIITVLVFAAFLSGLMIGRAKHKK
jgi:hypothetical protein